ncbi:MAG: class I SAM-dependent methyltransferase [Proteobacteria bacterium]|nr:class I SAM-dependent methyltransferase [Pseudomonadota bacterium]
MVSETLKDAPRLLARVARAYARRLGQCGTTAKGVFWKDETWQQRRFQRMLEAFDPTDACQGGISINDLGCGYGAFFHCLSELPVMTESSYIGYDITEEMVRACRVHIRDPRARFVRHMWATEIADYSFACGTFNLTGGAGDAEWRAYVEESLRHLWGQTTKALAFNMLRIDEFERFDGLYYIDPEELTAFCRTLPEAQVIMIDERPMPDVTYFLRRTRD